MREFKEQELANTAWAYATTGHQSSHLFQGIATETVRRLNSEQNKFKPQEMSNMVWAFATAGHQRGADYRATTALLGAIAKVITKRLGDFKEQELANTIWAYARLEHRDVDLFRMVSIEAQKRLADFKTQELANLVWAYASVSYRYFISPPRNPLLPYVAHPFPPYLSIRFFFF